MSIKPPTDIIGNPLAEGNLVRVHLQTPEIIGKIIKLSVGGVDLPGQKNTKTAGFIVVQAMLPLNFQPEATLPGFLRVVDPESQKIVEAASGIGEVAKLGPTLVKPLDTHSKSE